MVASGVCHYIWNYFIRIFGGIFMWSTFINFIAFSGMSVRTQIVWSLIFTGIASTEFNSSKARAADSGLLSIVLSRLDLDSIISL